MTNYAQYSTKCIDSKFSLFSNEPLNQFYIWITTDNTAWNEAKWFHMFLVLQFKLGEGLALAENSKLQWISFGFYVLRLSHFRAWSIAWPCGSKEKMVSLLRLTQLSVWSPAITMESMITLKSSQLSQQCLTQTLINSPKIQNSFAHLDSFWNRGKRELVNGPLHILKAEERTHHS